MKLIYLAGTLVCAILCLPFALQSQTNSVVPAARAADLDQATSQKHVRPVLAALRLNDVDKEARVGDVLAAQFQALKTWHAQNDPQIKVLWGQFNAARSKPDTAGANAALEKIDAVYAGFKLQHDKFLAELSSVLTPEQIGTVKDTLTVNKVKVTYEVYLQIFPTLSEAQKAVVRQELEAAREEAIDCESMLEKSAFFKKHKIRIEDDYLTAQGYDPKQARKDFAVKQSAGTAKKPATAPVGSREKDPEGF